MDQERAAIIPGFVFLKTSLEGILDTAAEDSADYRIAHYLLEICYTVDRINVADVAEHCFVSKSKVSRFCRAIGYGDFQDINSALAQAFVRGEVTKFDAFPVDKDETIPFYLDGLAQCVAAAQRCLRQEDVDRVAADIMDHERVGILGRAQANSVGIDLQRDLINTRKVTTAPLFMASQRAFIESSDEHTFLLVISCSGTYFQSFRQRPTFAEGHRPTMCLVTNNPRAARAGGFDYVVTLPCPDDYAHRPLLNKLFCNCVAIRCAQIADERGLRP